MTVLTKRKNNLKSKSKTLSKSNKGSSSRKHLIKTRKNGTKTRKMRGGGVPKWIKNLGKKIAKPKEVVEIPNETKKPPINETNSEMTEGKNIAITKKVVEIPNEIEKPPINETNSEMTEGKKTIKFKINFLNLEEGKYIHCNLIDNQTNYKISVRYNYDTHKTFPEKQLNSIRIDKPGNIIGAGHGAEVPENITMHLVNTYNRDGINVNTTLENKDEIDVEIELDTQPFTVHHIKLNEMILKPSDELDKDYFTQKFKVVKLNTLL
jgi:hypothetical protein